MNKVTLLGRLTKDPEIRYTQSGKVVCTFTLAVNRPFTSKTGQREADFIPCVLWGKQAELAGNSFAKGQRTLVEGRLQIRTYDDDTGVRRWVTEVICHEFYFIEKKNQGGSAGNQNGYGDNAYGSGMEDMGQEVPFEEEIPF